MRQLQSERMTRAIRLGHAARANEIFTVRSAAVPSMPRPQLYPKGPGKEAKLSFMGEREFTKVASKSG
jgi:hypothetical protein